MTSPHLSQPAMGRTLIIANPAAQRGGGAVIAEQLQRFLQMYLHDDAAFVLVRTEGPRHATALAAQARGYDAVLALGGDGVIHEVANGLMRHPASSRPALGLIPVGSGNDFATTLGLSAWSSGDFSRLLRCERVAMDVGRVRYRPSAKDARDEGRAEAHGANASTPVASADATSATTAAKSPIVTEHFVQTCSFGLDAAIGIDTYTMREKTGLTGAALYAASGLNVFGLHYRSYPARVSFDGGEARRLDTLLMAIQMGPTYGSGFRICPDADPSDGLLDVCYACGPYPRALALPLFLSAKNGGHVGHRRVHLLRAKSVSIAFEQAGYPIQLDGEQLHARAVGIDILPRALTVLKPV